MDGAFGTADFHVLNEAWKMDAALPTPAGVVEALKCAVVDEVTREPLRLY
jgi:hypothetical protein